MSVQQNVLLFIKKQFYHKAFLQKAKAEFFRLEEIVFLKAQNPLRKKGVWAPYCRAKLSKGFATKICEKVICSTRKKSCEAYYIVQNK